MSDDLEATVKTVAQNQNPTSDDFESLRQPTHNQPYHQTHKKLSNPKHVRLFHCSILVGLFIFLFSLHQLLRPFLLRRLKSEVMQSMPEKTEHNVIIKLSKWQEIIYTAIGARALRTVNEGNVGFK